MREIKLSPADIVADGNHYFTPDAEVEGVLYVEGCTVTEIQGRDGGEDLIHIQGDLGWSGARSADHLYIEDPKGEIEAMTYDRIGTVMNVQILVDDGDSTGEVSKAISRQWAEEALPEGVGAIKRAHLLGAGPAYDKTEHALDHDGEVLAQDKPHYEHDHPIGISIHGALPIHKAVKLVMEQQAQRESEKVAARPVRGPWSKERIDAFHARIRGGATNSELLAEFNTTPATIAKHRKIVKEEDAAARERHRIEEGL